VNVIAVQRLLGHASASMTLDVYGHFIPTMAEQTTAAMESALG
jgi:integrase